MPIVVPLPRLLRLLRTYEYPRKLGIMERMFGKSLAKYGICWVECSNGIIWKLNLADSCHRWIVYGFYEGNIQIPWAITHLGCGGVYVDSGANIGQWLLYMASMPNVKTIAIEPVKSERLWLTECLAQQAQWDVSTLDCGLGAQAKSVDIQCAGAQSTTNLDWYVGKGLKITSIRLERLDDLLKKNGVESVRLWKLDVEGGELEAIKGAEQYLKEKKIEALIFECHPKNFTLTSEYLRSNGYQIYTIEKSGPAKYVGERLTRTKNLLSLPQN